MFDFIWISSNVFVLLIWIILENYRMFEKEECTPLFFLKFSILFLILVFLYTLNMPSVDGFIYCADIFVYSKLIKMLKLFLIFLVLVIHIIAYFFLETLFFLEFVPKIWLVLLCWFLLISSNSLVFTFMFIQLQSISLYLLIVFCISSYAVREVAFTYLRFNSYSNMIWLFVFYCICNGTTIIQEIKIFLDLVLFECNTMLIVGVLFLFVDWVFKLAVFWLLYWKTRNDCEKL